MNRLTASELASEGRAYTRRALAIGSTAEIALAHWRMLQAVQVSARPSRASEIAASSAA